MTSTLTEVIIHLLDPTEDNGTLLLSLKANDELAWKLQRIRWRLLYSDERVLKKIQLLRGWIERMTPKEAKEEQEDDDEEEVVKKNATRRV